MADERMPYQSEDEAYGALLGNVLNPPDEPQAQQATAQGATPTPAPTQAADPRMAVPAGEPANPTLKTRPAPVVAPAQVAVRPAVVPTPNTVTPSGNGPTAPAPQKSWPDYVRGGLDAATRAQSQSQAATDAIQAQPTAMSANDPLEAQRSALAQPLNPNDPNYKPGLGTRIVRGWQAAKKGGAIAALDPSAVGATPYSAPNNRFAIDTARRQAQVGSLDQQMGENIANQKADTERLGKIGTEQRANATAALGIGKAATEQETAENNQDLADVKRQLANERSMPTTDIGLRVKAATEKDPALRQQYQTALDGYVKQETKKFQYAARATGGGDDDPRRQPMIDAATAKVDELNAYEFDPDYTSPQGQKGGFYDPKSPAKVLTPDEFTAEKNKISTQLDKDLSAKKMRPLGVRFNVKATTPGSAQPAAQSGAPAAAPSAQPPTPPAGATHVYKDAKGNVAGYAVNGKYVPVGAK